MNSFNRPPIPSPHDNEMLPPSSSQWHGRAVVGRFFRFGLFGQIAYTVLEVGIASGATSNTKHQATDWQFALLIIPLVCALWGAISARNSLPSRADHPLSIAVIICSGAVLGLFNLFVFALTGMAGYC